MAGLELFATGTCGTRVLVRALVRVLALASVPALARAVLVLVLVSMLALMLVMVMVPLQVLAQVLVHILMRVCGMRLFIVLPCPGSGAHTIAGAGVGPYGLGCAAAACAGC